MSRRKHKKTPKSQHPTGWLSAWTGADPAALYVWRMRALKLAVVIAAAAAGYVGLDRLNRWVLASADGDRPARIVLVDVPPDLYAEVSQRVGRLNGASFSSPTLCADVAAAVEATGWVKSVVRVQRHSDHRVEVHCEYRAPFALVHSSTGLLLVDDDGVRLPGVYAVDPAFKMIQGVDSLPPDPGQKWAAADLQAGVELIKLLGGESFSDQIVAVRVHNYAGRRDSRKPHIELATDRTGGRIIWGSGLGDEIEENTPAQKLELLRTNYRRFGHVDADRRVIDVSVLPDRIYAPA